MVLVISWRHLVVGWEDDEEHARRRRGSIMDEKLSRSTFRTATPTKLSLGLSSSLFLSSPVLSTLCCSLHQLPQHIALSSAPLPSLIHQTTTHHHV